MSYLANFPGMLLRDRALTAQGGFLTIPCPERSAEPGGRQLLLQWITLHHPSCPSGPGNGWARAGAAAKAVFSDTHTVMLRRASPRRQRWSRRSQHKSIPTISVVLAFCLKSLGPGCRSLLKKALYLPRSNYGEVRGDGECCPLTY